MILTLFISPSIIKEQQDSYGMGRWTSITINGRNKTKVTIISTYRNCIRTMKKIRTKHYVLSQQWDMLEEKGERDIDIRSKMINDIIILINKLQAENHEVVLTIDTNESFDPGQGGVTKLISMTDPVDPIVHQRGQNE